MRRSRLALALALTALPGWSCGQLGPDRSDLERARARWEATRPARYTYAVERVCFCPRVGPARLTVDGDEIVALELLEGAPEWFEPTEDWYPTVDGLFDLLEDALDRDAHRITVTYDPDEGVPLEFFIDYAENIADEELGMRVTEPVAAAP